MAVNVNLSRNTKVYFSTNGSPGLTGFGDHNTCEIQVLNGYTFSQGTEQETIQINEAGVSPKRGQRSFNSKLNPVEWSFTTYVRPKKYTAATSITCSAGGAVTYTTRNGVITNADALLSATATPATSGLYFKIGGLSGNSTVCNSTSVVQVKKEGAAIRIPVPPSHSGAALTGTATLTGAACVVAPEMHLWNALVNPYPIISTTYGQAWTSDTGSAALTVTNSNVHQLAPFYLIFRIDNQYYRVNNCAINQAEMNFGIDQIAQISWSGMGTDYETFDATHAGATELGSILAADTTGNYIVNKLSTISIAVSGGGAASSTNGTVTAGTAYTLPITGGAFTVNNNLTYLTPENLGVVNNTIGYFTGTRAVSGNLTAYLRSGGTVETQNLLSALLTGASTSSENSYSMIISVGGVGNTTHVEIPIGGAMLQIPAVEVQDVVSTTINFTAQAYTGSYGANFLYDINSANEFGLTYKTA